VPLQGRQVQAFGVAKLRGALTLPRKPSQRAFGLARFQGGASETARRILSLLSVRAVLIGLDPAAEVNPAGRALKGLPRRSTLEGGPAPAGSELFG